MLWHTCTSLDCIISLRKKSYRIPDNTSG
uniref:Uncharacterized protein n=1 Tax=Arundo donax TaxID=35708 RepID=A0A0A9EFG9_ARUDO